MSEPYSADLRDRVLIAYEQGEDSQVAIARRFRVCPATVSNWIRQARQEGRRCPKPHRGGPASVLVSGKQVSPPVMCRALQRLKLSVKKAPGDRAGAARDRQ